MDILSPSSFEKREASEKLTERNKKDDLK